MRNRPFLVSYRLVDGSFDISLKQNKEKGETKVRWFILKLHVNCDLAPYGGSGNFILETLSLETLIVWSTTVILLDL